MIKNFFAASFLCFLWVFNTGATFNVADQDIKWDRKEHDFGSVMQGEVVETNFTVLNNRKDTLVVENVVGSCGCIASKWPHQPMLPGIQGNITVKFDTKGKSGNHMKSVSVYTNRGVYHLGLKANIIQK